MKCFTCHQTDSTTLVKIQDSTFSNAAVKVSGSCQSSLKPLVLFSFSEPVCSLPNACEVISLRVTTFDNQNVNLKHKEKIKILKGARLMVLSCVFLCYLETSFPQDLAAKMRPETVFLATVARFS